VRARRLNRAVAADNMGGKLNLKKDSLKL